MTCAPNRREAKKAETREALARAALQLAVDHGPDRVTVDKISDAAGVSARTFFNHFESKEDAILDFDVDEMGEFDEALRGRPGEEAPLVALRAVFLEMAPPRHADRDAMAIRMRLAHEHPALHARMLVKFGAFEDNMAQALAGRLDLDLAVDPRPRIIAAAVLSSIRTAAMHEMETTGDHDIAAIATRVFDFLEAGFADLT